MPYDPVSSGDAEEVQTTQPAAEAQPQSQWAMAPSGSAVTDSNQLASNLGEGLKPYASNFVESGTRHGVDPALLASIAMHETGRGTSRAFLQKQNAMGVSSNEGPISFTNAGGVPASIERMAQRIGKDPVYAPARQAGTIDALSNIYAPIGASNDPYGQNKDWTNGVSRFYKQFSGDQNLAAPTKEDANSALNALGSNPDTVAKAHQVAQNFDVPIDLTLRDPQTFNNADTANQVGQQLAKVDENGNLQNPITAQWASDPVNLAKSHDDIQNLQAIEQTAKRSKYDPVFMGLASEVTPNDDIGRPRSMFGSAGQSLSNVFSGGIKGSQVLLRKLGIPTMFEMSDFINSYEKAKEQGAPDSEAVKAYAKDLPVTETPLYKAGQAIEEQSKKLLPTNPEIAQEFWSGKIPGMLGMTGGFLLGGGVGAGLKIPALANAALAVASTAGGAYDEAKAKGATEEQAVNAGTAIAPTGLLYMIVPNQMLGRLWAGAGGQVTGSMIKTAMKEGTTAAGLFAAQTGLSNTVAKQIYDKDRDYWDGVVQSGAEGGVSSAIASMLVSIATGKKLPVVQLKNSPNEAQVLVNSHLEQVQQAHQDIAAKEGESAKLEQLKSIADTSKLAQRDPQALAEFINSNLEQSGEEKTISVDAKAVSEALFQDAKTPEESQAKVEQFAKDMALDPKQLNDAIRNGGNIDIDQGALVAKYRDHPVFKAIQDHLKDSAETAKSDLVDQVSKFKEDLKSVVENTDLPDQLKEVRSKLMEQGRSAVEADHQTALLTAGLKTFATRRGETLAEYLKKSPVEVKVGEDGKTFVQSSLLQPAYHGTPHEITDQFKLEKIGTGEGAQAYGWGLYFAENPEVANQYKSDLATEIKVNGKTILKNNKLVETTGNHDVDDLLIANHGDKAKALEDAGDSFPEAKKFLESAKVEAKNSGNVYTVDINDKATETFLDWDKPFSGQSEQVQKALTQAIKKLPNNLKEKILANKNKASAAFIYGQLEIDLGSAKEASKYLNSLGVKGIRFLDQTSRTAGKGSSNFVVFDSSAVKITHKNGEPFTPSETLFQNKQSPRGAFEPTTSGNIIHLFKAADRSTFLHESAHLFTHELRKMVESGLADQTASKDYVTLAEWAGAKDGKWNVKAEEKVARGFEAYLMEGKAPSVGLADAFRRFKDWLKNIYKSATGLNVSLSDDVRNVFDRMLASEHEIKEAREYYSLNNDVVDLVTKDEKKRAELKQKRDELEKAQEAKQTAAQLGSIEAVKDHATIEKEARNEVDQNPVYKALDKAKAEGISLDSVRESFGEKTADELTSKYPDIFKEDGKTSIESLTVDHEFNSPDDLLKALREAPPKEDAVTQLKAQKIDVERQKIYNKSNPQDATTADAATHTDDALKYLIKETQALVDDLAKQGALKKYRIIEKAYKDVAKEKLAAMTVSEARSYYKFAWAEKKLGRDVIRLLQKGKKQEALEARMKQLYNHALVGEAIKAREEISRIEDRYAPSKLISTMKNVEDAFQAPIAELLSRFNFTNKNKVPFDFNKIGDIDPVLAAELPDIVKSGKSIDYKQLSLDELRDVDAYAQTLMHVGRDTMRSLDEAKQRKVSDVVAESTGNMSQLKNKTLAAEGTTKQKFQKFWKMLTASTIQVHFLTKMADNFIYKTTGQIGIMEKLYQKMIDVQVREKVMQHEIAKSLDPHFKVLDEARRRIEKQNGKYFDVAGLPIPKELEKAGRGKWTAERLISLMLNTGNDGNRKALENAYQFREPEISAAAKFFDSKELKSIQGVWDTIDKLYPELDKTHFEAYNRHVEKVDGTKSSLLDREGKKTELEGGYYPLKFDSEINQDAGRNAETDLMEQNAGVLRKVKPADGVTKSRTPGHSLPPMLSMDVLNRHIADTIHYITHAEIVRDWNRVTSNKEWVSSFTDKFGSIDKNGADNYSQLRKWLKDQAQTAPPPPSSPLTRFWENLFNKQRGLATVAAFGLNVKSGVLIHHSLLNAAYALDWKWLASGFKDLDAKTLMGSSHGQTIQEIAALSPWMKDHIHSWDRDVRAMSEDIKPGGGKGLDRILRKASGAMGKEISLNDARQGSMFLLTAAHQRMAAGFWRGAFNKYMSTLADAKATMSENTEKAARYADSMVQELSPTSLKAELNAVQRDQGFMKFLTAFMSWNFKYGGRMQYENRAWKEGKISTKDYLSHQFHETLAPALVRTALLGAMSATAPTAWQWISSPLETFMSWIPILKDVSKVFHVSAKTKKIDFDVTSAVPALEGGKRIAKAGTSTWKWANDEKDAGSMVWDWARATDYFTGTGATKPAHDLMQFYKNVENKDDK